MILATLLLAAAGVLDAREPFEVQPRIVEGTSLPSRAFDPRWCLPERAASRDLLREMRGLLALRFDATDAEGRALRCFGDVVSVFRSLPPAEREAWFRDLRERAPEFVGDWGEGLAQLLFDEDLYGADWDPEDDLDRDGMVTADSWSLKAAGRGPWDEVGGDPRVEQLATLIFGDLTAIKAAENDYRQYYSNIGAEYEEIYPVPESYVRGTGPDGAAFAYLQLYFASDLPFPFGGYECDLRILNRLDAEGCLRTDIYSVSEDFNWLAGRDVFLPVRTSDGTWVAELLVRVYGFDIDNVPDKPSHRRLALRSSVGNLRRRAESLFAAARTTPTTEAAVPEFRVLGAR